MNNENLQNNNTANNNDDSKTTNPYIGMYQRLHKEPEPLPVSPQIQKAISVLTVIFNVLSIITMWLFVIEFGTCMQKEINFLQSPVFIIFSLIALVLTVLIPIKSKNILDDQPINVLCLIILLTLVSAISLVMSIYVPICLATAIPIAIMVILLILIQFRCSFKTVGRLLLIALVILISASSIITAYRTYDYTYRHSGNSDSTYTSDGIIIRDNY